jgi:hypothetical protein
MIAVYQGSGPIFQAETLLDADQLAWELFEGVDFAQTDVVSAL